MFFTEAGQGQSRAEKDTTPKRLLQGLQFSHVETLLINNTYTIPSGNVKKICTISFYQEFLAFPSSIEASK